MSASLFSPLTIRGKVFPNRIVMPPMVLFNALSESGMVNDRHIAHYTKRAKGTGGIIVEAIAVQKNAVLCLGELGVWEDAQIPGLKRLVDALKVNNLPVIGQLLHAGSKNPVEADRVTSTPGPHTPGRALSLAEIEAIKKSFVAGARRLIEAGFDGVEIHGCHGFLLNQFTSPAVNQRTDAYGGDIAKRHALSVEVVRAIRKELGDSHIVGMRYSLEDKTTEGPVMLQDAGVDYLHFSRGFSCQLQAPAGFKFSPSIFCGSEAKKVLTIPVIAANDLRTPEQAKEVIETGLADLCAMGRALLVAPSFASDLKDGRQPILCFRCARCRWYGAECEDGCPGYQKWAKETAKSAAAA